MVGPIEYSFRSFFFPPRLNSRHINWKIIIHINWKIIISKSHSYFLLRKFYEYFFSFYFVVGGWNFFFLVFCVDLRADIINRGHQQPSRWINHTKDSCSQFSSVILKFSLRSTSPQPLTPLLIPIILQITYGYRFIR